MVGLELLLCLLAVSLLWGITNPLLKRASVGIENIQMSNPVMQVRFMYCTVRSRGGDSCTGSHESHRRNDSVCMTTLCIVCFLMFILFYQPASWKSFINFAGTVEYVWLRNKSLKGSAMSPFDSSQMSDDSAWLVWCVGMQPFIFYWWQCWVECYCHALLCKKIYIAKLIRITWLVWPNEK